MTRDQAIAHLVLHGWIPVRADHGGIGVQWALYRPEAMLAVYQWDESDVVGRAAWDSLSNLHLPIDWIHLPATQLRALVAEAMKATD